MSEQTTAQQQAEYRPAPTTADDHAHNLGYLVQHETDEAILASLHAGADALRGSGAARIEELLDLAKWIEQTYRLADSPKIRERSQAEDIYAELVKRIALVRQEQQT